MEQIYMIPVNEAFEATAADPAVGCPLCLLRRRLEERELDLILGASMMEPDVRLRTNAEGFCRLHYDMMLARRNRLGVALMLESRLAELREGLRESALGAPGSRPAARVAELEAGCYVCRRVEQSFDRMLGTVLLLWRNDPSFVPKLEAQPFLCLPHYRALLERARREFPKRAAAEFATVCGRIVRAYMEAISADVSRFCRSFDYRFSAEPFEGSRDAVERAVRFLRSDLHGSGARTPGSAAQPHRKGD